jgi:hypothetical protein
MQYGESTKTPSFRIGFVVDILAFRRWQQFRRNSTDAF